MRFNRILVVGLVAGTSGIWMACGGDDAAVNNSGDTDSGTSDATTAGGDGSTGTDSGNPGDAGARDSAAADAGCTVAFPLLPAGEVVCPGAPGGECGDGGPSGHVCCLHQCQTDDICISSVGFASCERSADCTNNRSCCLKPNAAIDLGASTCPLTGSASALSCAPVSNQCAAGDYIACASDAECDGGKCRALSVTIADGGTILGVCAP